MRASAVVEADDRRAILKRHVHDLADFLGVGLSQRAPENSEVLREHVDQAAVDFAVARHDAVAEELLLVQPKIRRPVGHQLAHLLERARIEQELKALAGSQFALAMLCFNARFSTPFEGFCAHGFQTFRGMLHDAKLRTFPWLTAGFPREGQWVECAKVQFEHPTVPRLRAFCRIGHPQGT